MKILRWMVLWLCMVGLMVSSGIIFGDTVPAGMDILAKIRESRQSIQRGQVEVVTSSSSRGYQNFRKEWHIWFDGDTKRRSDVIQDGYTEAVCLDCYAERTDLQYTTHPPTDPNTTMALVFRDGYDEISPGRIVPNPRWFGCFPDSIANAELYLVPLDIYKSRSDKSAELPKVISDVRGKIACWKVDWEFVFKHNGDSASVPCSVWVDKSDISHILRVESRFEAGGVQYVDGVDSESEKYQNKIWFPKKLTYRRTENGKVIASQDSQIKVISLNEPLHSDTFSPKGISFLKPGTPVSWAMERDRPVEKVALVWDGSNVVARGTFEIDKVMNESARFKPLSMFLILSGIALILFGIGMKLWKKYAT